MPLNVFFSIEKQVSAAIYILKCPEWKQRMSSDSNKILYLWALLLTPLNGHYVFPLNSLLVFSHHSSQKLLEVTGFIFKGGINPVGWPLFWENPPQNYYPWQCFSPKAQVLESTHIWDCSIMTDEMTCHCSGKIKERRGAIHGVNMDNPPS